LKIGSKTFALTVASLLLVAVVATNLQQQQSASAFGFIERQQFKKLTHDFEKGVIAALEDPENIPEALNAYSQGVLQIFIGDPGLDQVRTLLQGNTDDVTRILNQQPPEPEKQVKDFRSLTHDFEKAVIGLSQPPEPE
jgi:hypothetical protein